MEIIQLLAVLYNFCRSEDILLKSVTVSSMQSHYGSDGWIYPNEKGEYKKVRRNVVIEDFVNVDCRFNH